jgi:GNAT superfamily N-acetyltransferase
MTQHTTTQPNNAPKLRVGIITKLSDFDMQHLCEATELAIKDGIGFNWMTAPVRETLEAYWSGVIVMPQRILFGAWLDGVLCGSVQLIKQPKSRETKFFSARLEAHFIAPWARGHGLASQLLKAAEYEAAKLNFSVIRLSVRETQEQALHLYNENGYIKWGVLPCFEMVAGEMVAGHYFYKVLEPLSLLE